MEFPVYSRNGLTIVKGQGARVWDDQGKEYVDFYGGHAVAALGYGHPALTKAVQEQVARLVFQTNAVDLDIRAQACEAIASAAPQGLDSVFLISSGAEANENALRLAFVRNHGRTKVVALQGGFHGRTAAAGAVTYGSASWYAFPRTPFDVEFVPLEDVAALDAALDDDTAAFIFEPIQGVAGAIAVSPEFAQAARRLCTERGIVMVDDEVQCGIGRSGRTFACEVLGVVPDVITAAKGLGGGIPVGAVIARQDWVSGLGIGSFGTTFGGGPVACAAVVATLAEITRPGFLEHLRAVSARLVAESVVGPVQRVSGGGLLLGLHCAVPAKDVRAYLKEKGLLTGDAKDPSVVRLLPPLVICDEEVDILVRALKDWK